MRIGKIIFNFVVCVVFVVGLTSLSLAKNKFEKEVDDEQAAVKLVREVQNGGYDVITAKELKDLMDSGTDVLIIDTMPYDDSYKKAHVPGAKQFLFPIPDMKEWNTKETGGKTENDFKALLGPEKNRTIVVYCGFVKCTRSHNGAMWAVKSGYKNVLRFPGGIFAWKGAGYPIEKAK
jgi:rhodanese-related sulfurtransferase